MAPRYCPAIFPVLASSRTRRRRLAQVRLMRADRSNMARAQKLRQKLGRVWAEAETWAESLCRDPAGDIGQATVAQPGKALLRRDSNDKE